MNQGHLVFSRFTAASLIMMVWLCGTSAAVACPDLRLQGEHLSFSSDELWTPRTRRLVAGGNANLADCPAPGIGHVASAPDFSLYFTDNARRRDLVIRVEGTCDTVLLVNDPDVEWRFDDDSDGVDPAMTFSAAVEGLYDIWVGTYGETTCSAHLILETFPGTTGTPSGESGATTASGTGFVINQGGWVLTNAHVVEGCGTVDVVGYGRVLRIVRDGAEDLAALHLGRSVDVKPLAFRTRPARLAEPVHAVGFPLSDILSQSVRVTSGTVNALSGLGQRQNLIQISAPIQPGNSGGPVIDSAGRVIGVTTATLSESAYDRAQNVNFALPSAEAVRFLEQNGIGHERADGDPAPTGVKNVSDHVEASAAATVLIRCLVEGVTQPAATPVVRPSAADPTMIVQRGVDVIGYDYRTIRNASLPDCRTACEGERRCRAFTYNSRHQVCFLKDGASLLARNDDAVGGYVQALSDTVLNTGFRIQADRDTPGGDYARIRDSDFLPCFLECAVATQCRAFAYVKRTRDCWLKDRIGSLRSVPGVELGLR